MSDNWHWDRYTEELRRAVYAAQAEAASQGTYEIRTDHLLSAILSVQDSAAGRILDEIGISKESLKDGLGKRSRLGLGGRRQWELSASARKMVEDAVRISIGLDHEYTGTGHVLLSMLWQKQGFACEVLTSHGVDLAVVEQRLGEEHAKRPQKGRFER